MKKLPLIVLAFAFACSKPQQNGDQRMTVLVDSIMSKLTPEEKIGQLNLPSAGEFVTGAAENSDIAKKIEKGQVGGLFNIKSVKRIREIQKIAIEKSRAKIPLYFGMDVIHGYETVFPIPIGLSASWDMDLIQKTARMAATEASADGINMTFSPMVDLTRDPRWGRLAEGSGEDPFLGSQIARAMVKGYQGDNLSANNTIMSCVKHFALYGAAEAGRDYNTTDMSRLRMYSEYFPPYKATVDAGAGAIMASFNEIDGIPATANKWLLTEVLRNEWKFTGLTMSDYTGVSEMMAHGLGDLPTVSAKALDAGVDMDMVSEGFLTTLQQSSKDGKITEKQIDDACRRVLEAKYKLGLFSDPYRYCNEERAKKEVFTDENRAFARSVASQCFVLLKNSNNVLPLKKLGTIALIGPLADAIENMTGTWAVAADNTKSITLLKGLQEAVGDASASVMAEGKMPAVKSNAASTGNGLQSSTPKAKILYAKGSNLFENEQLEINATPFGKGLHRDKRTSTELREEALKIAAMADVIVAAVGESAEMTGEASSRSDLNIPDTQEELLKALVKTGKPVVLVLFTGRPLTIKWENENIPAILNVWAGGSEAGNAISDVLFGDVNPSGKLTMTFPQNVGQVPIYYAHKNTGRPLRGPWFQKFQSNYLDVPNEPLYPFGFGLSYTQFTYGDVAINKNQISNGEPLTVTCKVTNTGKMAGAETVQLYIRDWVGSVTRPVKELKGFQKIFLQPGESKEVIFKITTDELAFYHSDLSFSAEPGDFSVYVGGNSRDVKEQKFSLK